MNAFLGCLRLEHTYFETRFGKISCGGLQDESQNGTQDYTMRRSDGMMKRRKHIKRHHTLNDPQPIPMTQDMLVRIEIRRHRYLRSLSWFVPTQMLRDEQFEGETNPRKLTSSSGVKSFTMLKSLRISSGVLPLIMFATVLHPTSLPKPIRPTSNAVITRCLQQWLDVEVVGGKNDLEKHFLVNCDEFLVPLADVSCSLARFVRVLFGVCRRQRLSTMMFAVFQNLISMTRDKEVAVDTKSY